MVSNEVAALTMAYFILQGDLLTGCLGIKIQTEAIGGCAKLSCTNNLTGEDVTSWWYFENQTLLDPLVSHLNKSYNQDSRFTSKRSDDGRSASLWISNISFSDAGRYSCVMYTGSLKMWKENILLNVYGQTELRANKSIIVNETLTAVCCVDVTPISTSVEFSWILDNITFSPVTYYTQTNISYHLSHLCSFAFFRPVRTQHNKELFCVANDDWKGISKQMLNIWYPPTVQMVSSSTINVANDADILLVICMVEGNPTPDVFLQKLDDMFEWQTIDLKPLNKSNLTTQLWEFQLPSKDNYVNGMYRCTTSNALGNIDVSSIVSVETEKNSSISRSDNSWMTYALVVCATFILAVIFTRSTQKRCFSRYASLRREVSQTQDFVLTPVDNVTKYYLDQYMSMDKEDTDPETQKLREFDRKDVAFVVQLNKDMMRERWLGILHKGTAAETYTHMRRNTDVTIASEEWKYFLRHIAILPINENVVKTFGIVQMSGIPYCLQEYMAFGTLKSYLEVNFGQSRFYGNALEPVPHHFLTFASNVISGMKFLHHYCWLHPGLSTEKLLISQSGHSGFSCKLHDFCYAIFSGDRVKEELEKNNGKIRLNIPPEAKRNGEYTQQSDLWAVGVVLWEIFSYGAKIPEYREIQRPTDVLGKLTRPANCPGQLYEAMSLCWQWDQQSRLSFDELNEYLQSTTETYMVMRNQQVHTGAALSAMEPQPDIYNKEIYKVSN
ncbi:uncharacterized protein [Apostichopus japonicus]|uniref:uncharacterized protein isoform X2 n=1 Tax=Stichopus japonicus TaxID=307972 RepID=UPI003AB26BCC